MNITLKKKPRARYKMCHNNIELSDNVFTVMTKDGKELIKFRYSALIITKHAGGRATHCPLFDNQVNANETLSTEEYNKPREIIPLQLVLPIGHQSCTL